MLRAVLFFPIALFASMLSDAQSIGQRYAQELAKRPPPSPLPQTKNLLGFTSAWLSIDLENGTPLPGKSILETLGENSLWQILEDLGIDGIYFKGLKEGGAARTGFGIDPKWGKGWDRVKVAAAARGIALIGDLLGSTTGPCSDFELALQNQGAYTESYQLIEIDPKDWNLLPKIPVGSYFANVPWLKLDALYNQGYIPEAARPYVKESAWNATGKIRGEGGKERRWIYLKENKNDPVLSWLSPSFSADRMASADALHSTFSLGQHVLRIDGKIPRFAKETAALWIRKIGSFSAALTNGTLAELKTAPGDAAFDAATRPALLHALLTEDAGALHLIYNLYLKEGISPMRLVHALEPFDSSPLRWNELLANPKKTYLYREEKITGELLENRLLKEDLLRLKAANPESVPVSTWGNYCRSSFSNPEEIQKAHLLLAFAAAMQPGVFSISDSDLLGALGKGPLSLFDPNKNALYPSLPCQMQTPRSFASHLKKILAVRKECNIALGELVQLLPSEKKGTLILLHRLPSSRFFHLLALNFSRSPTLENIKLAGIQNTWAIDLMTGQAEEKVFEEGVFFFALPPLSGKVILFQPKYYD